MEKIIKKQWKRQQHITSKFKNLKRIRSVNDSWVICHSKGFYTSEKETDLGVSANDITYLDKGNEMIVATSTGLFHVANGNKLFNFFHLIYIFNSL